MRRRSPISTRTDRRCPYTTLVRAMVIAIVPAAGPVIGGFVYEWFGWRANFVLLAIIVAAALAAGAWRLPESLALDERVEIGRAHVCTPVTNAPLVCRLLLDNIII